jgi:hypothetical protein
MITTRSIPNPEYTERVTAEALEKLPRRRSARQTHLEDRQLTTCCSPSSRIAERSRSAVDHLDRSAYGDADPRDFDQQLFPELSIGEPKRPDLELSSSEICKALASSRLTGEVLVH